MTRRFTIVVSEFSLVPETLQAATSMVFLPGETRMCMWIANSPPNVHGQRDLNLGYRYTDAGLQNRYAQFSVHRILGPTRTAISVSHLSGNCDDLKHLYFPVNGISGSMMR